MWFVSSPGPKTQCGADKDEGRVCPQSQVVCKPDSGWGSWWGSRAEAHGKSKQQLLTCSLQGFGRGYAELGGSNSPSPVPPPVSSLAASVSLRLYPRESLPVTVDCFVSMPGYAGASGSAPTCIHVHRMGKQGGTLCNDPDLTPKMALHPVFG